MARRNPRTVYCHHTEPGYIPPPRLSEHMVVVGPFMETRRDGDQIRSLASPKGRYDLSALLQELPADQAPEVILVSIDATAVNEPANLAAFKCPKVALLADTHHLKHPMRSALSYLADESFDCHIALYNLRHAHWFAGHGLKQVHWLPSLNVAGHTAPPVKETIPEIIFVGQSGIYHPRRRRVLDAIEAHALPLRHFQAPAAQAARHYRAARISLNCSLNGDLNMRVFEIMAAGGLVLTDRLAPQSGLSDLFRDGEHLAAYGSVEELLEKTEHYLGHPEEAARIAAAGAARYGEHFMPERVAECLWDLVFENTASPLFDTAHDARVKLAGQAPRPAASRFACYEFLQELHRRHETVSLLALPGTAPELLSDAADLPRLYAHLAHDGEPDAAARDYFIAAGVSEQISDIALADARRSEWDILLAPPADTAAAHFSSGEFRAGHILVPGLAGNDAAALETALEKHGYARADSDIAVFSRLAAESATPDAAELTRLRQRHGLSDHASFAHAAAETIGLSGKNILEIGGPLPEGFARDDLGAATWLAISGTATAFEDSEYAPDGPRLKDFTAAADLPPYQALSGPVAELPRALYGQFDAVVSFHAFTRLAPLSAALERMYFALRPGGALFAVFAPLWSSSDGHQLPPVTDRSGRVMAGANSPVPPWGHLLLRPAEMHAHLLNFTDAGAAADITDHIYHAPVLNRLFTEDYAAILAASRFDVAEISTSSTVKINARKQQELETLHPDRKHFTNRGLRIVLRRPE